MASQPAGQAQHSSLWKRTRSSGKSSFDWLWRQADEKIGQPSSRLAKKIGSESFWPSDLKTESDKAARIVNSFCQDGFYDEELTKTEGGPSGRQRVLKKIPSHVIANCRGLAIFTAMRTGLWMSGSGGSGIVVAKTENGWSGPIGIMLHQAGVGFMAGIDIYDCVLVLNTDEAVQAFSKWRATIGSELSIAAGPVGVGAQVEFNGRRAPIFSYMKSKGFYCGVHIDGSVILERTDENERFYGQKLPAKDILAGKHQSRQIELSPLFETLKAAEGDASARQALIPTDASPSDMDVIEPGQTFGLPSTVDDDPYGVRALEKQGLFVRDAGTKQIVPETEFEFAPKPTSPVFRDSGDGSRSARSSWRESVATRGDSAFGHRRYTTMSDVSTQTDFPLETASAPPTTALAQHEFAAYTPDEAEEDEWKASSDGAPSPTSRQTSAKPIPPPLPPRGPLAVKDAEGSVEQAGESQSSLPVDLAPPQVSQSTQGAEIVAAVEPQSMASANDEAVPETLSPEPADTALRDEATEVPKPEGDGQSTSFATSMDIDRPAPQSRHDDVHKGGEQETLQVQQASRPQVITKASAARIVTVAKRVPPKLPERNPGRGRGRVSGSVTPNSVQDLSPARDKEQMEGVTPESGVRRGSETSDDKASSFRSVAVSESTEGDKAETLKTPASFSGLVSPPAIPERSRSREQTPRAEAVDASVAQQVTSNAVKPVEKLSPAFPSLATPALTDKQETKASLSHLGEKESDDDDNDDDDDYIDDISDAEIVTATPAVAQQRKTPGPRISMAQIRDSLHNNRSPSPRGRTTARSDAEDFS